MPTTAKMKPIELLSNEIRSEIDREAAKYPPPQKGAAVMAALRIVQELNGWLSTDLIEAVALYLEIPPVRAMEVATFYTMYDLEPVGRHKILVCTNISCMLCGSEKIMTHLSKTLGIKAGETTKDGRITLKEAECLGACANAPMMMVDKQYHEDLTPQKVDEILKGLT